MRKSSLGRRSNTSAFAADVPSSRGERRSMLLQPGFSQTKRAASTDRASGISSRNLPSVTTHSVGRSASTDRVSGISSRNMPPVTTHSVHRSRSERSLLETLPPCTPALRQSNDLPSGSSRPNRSAISSMDSNRYSSFGGTRTTKKETRPVTDKTFQSLALKKVQDFFLKQPNCQQILDNSMNVRPLNIKKFANMVDYLLRFLDERIAVTKDNYIEIVIKISKQLGYGGKVDKSWLVTVNAPHAWCHVIAFLVWLVDLVNIMNASDMIVLYPEDLFEENKEDVLEANFRYVKPHIVESFQFFLQHPKANLEEEFEQQDEQLVNMLLDRAGLSEDNLQAIAAEEEEVRQTAEAAMAHYHAEKEKIEKLFSDYQTLRLEHAELTEYIEKTNVYISTKREELKSLENELEDLVHNIEEKTIEREKLMAAVQESKRNMAQCNEDQKERRKLENIIQYNEKCMAELSKEIYQLDVKTIMILKKMEEPLISFNNIIAIHTKHEPRLKSCIMNEDNPKSAAEADEILTSLKTEWQRKCTEAEELLRESDCQSEILNQESEKVSEDLKKKKQELKQIMKDTCELLEHKEKTMKQLEEEIRNYENKTKTLAGKEAIIRIEERDRLKQLNDGQRAQIKADMELAEEYFTGVKKYREDVFQDLLNYYEQAIETRKEVKENNPEKNKIITT